VPPPPDTENSAVVNSNTPTKVYLRKSYLKPDLPHLEKSLAELGVAVTSLKEGDVIEIQLNLD
jgi:hypothetical protein